MVEKMDLDEMKEYYRQEATRLVKLRRKSAGAASCGL